MLLQFRASQCVNKKGVFLLFSATDRSNSKSRSDWIGFVPIDMSYLELLNEQRIPFKTRKQSKTETLKMRWAAKVLAQDEDKDRWKALCGFQS